MFPKQLSSYIEKERLFRRLCATKCLLRKSLAAGALCRHTSDVLLRFPEASSFGRMSRQGLFARGKSIPAQRNLPSGIIFPRRKHPCSKKSPVRDYFPETKASLLREIHRQRLFSRGKSIPAQRIPLSRIIFPRQKHPCSKKSTARDYFLEADASLLEEISRQGLFSQGKSIPARGNSPSEIIFPRQKHPCSEKSPVRDYFPETKASLLREISRQGLFSQGESIPAQRNPFSGIIFPRRMHPCSEKSTARDHFPETKASLLGEISRQGLFSQGKSILAQRNPPSWIIFPRLALCPQSYTDLSRTRRTQANVYQSYLIRWRTASFASSAAPEAGAVIPSCTPHYGRNLPVFFAKRG